MINTTNQSFSSYWVTTECEVPNNILQQRGFPISFANKHSIKKGVMTVLRFFQRNDYFLCQDSYSHPTYPCSSSSFVREPSALWMRQTQHRQDSRATEPYGISNSGQKTLLLLIWKPVNSASCLHYALWSWPAGEAGSKRLLEQEQSFSLPLD